jgi:small-conductance mechanosensitive channel
MTDLDKLVSNLTHPGASTEIGVVLGCLAVAYSLCWLVGRRQPADSVWFGRRIVDGLLFPLLSLVLVYTANRVLAEFQRVEVLKIAVPVLLSLVGIRLLARVLTIVFPNWAMARLIERLFSWMAWGAAVLWIVGLLPLVLNELDSIRFVFGKSKISLLSVAEGVLWSGVVLVVTLWISAALERRILVDAVSDLSLRKVAANAMRAVLLVLGLLLALSAIGFDLTALSVLGGALGVGLGFGLQKLAANYVSGFVILFERSLRIGDNVRVDGFEGVVSDITTRYTRLRADNGRVSIVPNELLITQRVENLHHADLQFQLQTNITVRYGSPVQDVMALMKTAAASAPRVLRQPGPDVYLINFAAQGLEFQLNYSIADPANGKNNVRSAVNVAVEQALRQAGIEIQPPQRVLQMTHTHES